MLLKVTCTGIFVAGTASGGTQTQTHHFTEAPPAAWLSLASLCLPTSRRPLPRSCGLGKESQALGMTSSLILGGFCTASQRPGPQALLPRADTLILTPPLISWDRPGKQISTSWDLGSDVLAQPGSVGEPVMS